MLRLSIRMKFSALSALLGGAILVAGSFAHAALTDLPTGQCGVNMSCPPGTGGGGICGITMSCPGTGGGGTCQPPVSGQPCTVGAAPATAPNNAPNSGAGNPLNVITGNKYQREEDLPALPGVLGLEIVRHYNSGTAGKGWPNYIMGRGWKLSYETELYVTPTNVQVLQADGSRLIFKREDNNRHLCTSEDPSNGHVEISKNSAATQYLWTWADGRRLTFDDKGKLIQIQAPTGEFVTLQHDPNGQLLMVTDPQGRSMRLRYQDKAQGNHYMGVVAIDTPVGRFGYEYGSELPKGATHNLKTPVIANLVKVSVPAHYDTSKQAHSFTERGVSSTSVTRHYHYEDARHHSHLTGISVNGTGSDGQLISQRLATWSYDDKGRAISSVKGDGKTEAVSLEFIDPQGGRDAWRTVLTNSLGQKTTYVRGTIAGQYRLMEVRGPGCVTCGETDLRYGYDDVGRLNVVTKLSAEGVPLHSTRTYYDAQGRALRVTRVAFEAGKPIGKAKEEELLRYEYAAAGADKAAAQRPIKVSRRSVVAGKRHELAFSYNSAGQMTSVTERGWAPSLSSLVRQGAPAAALPLERTTRYSYARINGRSLLVEVDGPLRNGPKADTSDSDITRFKYDERGDAIAAVALPGGFKQTREYDDAGRIRRVVDEDGYRRVQSDSAYAPTGQRLELSRSAWLVDARSGEPQTASLVVERTRFQYDALMRTTAIERPNGTMLRARFNDAGRPVAMVAPDGSQVVLDRDSESRLIGLDRYGDGDVKSHSVDLEYDQKSLMRLTSVRDELGIIARFEYDAVARSNARPSAVLHASGSTTRYRYDVDGAVVEQTRAAGTADAFSRYFERDAKGKAVRVVSGASGGYDHQVQVARYDDFGRKLISGSGDHGINVYLWDEADRLTAQADEGRNISRYRYDAAGRLVASGFNSKKDLVTYGYAGRLVAQVRATRDGNPANATEVKAYKYDGLGRVTEDLHWIERFGPNQKVSTGAAPQGYLTRTAYRYDAAGQLVERTITDVRNRVHSFGYGRDKAGRVVAITFNGAPVATDIQSTWAGGLKGFVYGNGLRETDLRDARGRLNARSVEQSDGKALLKLQYSYDQADRLIEASDGTEGPRQFRYDNRDRLVTEASLSGEAGYQYDPFGNRVAVRRGESSQRYAYQRNRLIAVEATTQQPGWLAAYNNGDMVLQTHFPPAVQAVKVSDNQAMAARLLRTVNDPSGRPIQIRDGNDRVLVSYGYGMGGERIRKTVETRSTYYRYESIGNTPYLTGEMGDDGTLVTQYVYLEGRPIAKIDTPVQDGTWVRVKRSVLSWFGKSAQAEAAIFAVHADVRRAPVMVSDSQGRVVWHASYDAFGKAVLRSGVPTSKHAGVVISAASASQEQGFEMNLRLAGHYYDRETGMHYNLRRNYNPETGRYLTPDPLQRDARLDLERSVRMQGDNPFTYVGNNPMTSIDPMGLYEEDIHYYMTFFLALAAGVNYEEARIIALATQYVDNNDDTDPFGSPGTQVQRLTSYHFVLSDASGNLIADYNNGDLLLPDWNPSPQLRNLMEASNRAPTRCAELQFFGEFLHAYEDTFSHRDRNNIPYEAGTSGLGHLFAGHQPDYTYNDALDSTDGSQLPNGWYNREARTLEMEKLVYTKMFQFSDGGPKALWEEIEQGMIEFNAIPENDSTGFGRKLDHLSGLLAQLNITRPDGSAIDFRTTEQYDQGEGATNRRNYLCEGNGGLDLSAYDYRGTILPGIACP